MIEKTLIFWTSSTLVTNKLFCIKLIYFAKRKAEKVKKRILGKLAEV